MPCILYAERMKILIAANQLNQFIYTLSNIQESSLLVIFINLFKHRDGMYLALLTR